MDDISPLDTTPIDAGFAGLLEQFATAELPPVQAMTVAQARDASAAVSLEAEPERRAEFDDVTFDGPCGPLRARIYRPPTDRPRGALVWFHGGGWVLGDLAMNDSTCHRLSVGADTVVASVNYRLAPEHPFPAAIDDAWASLTWFAGQLADWNVAPDRLAIGGESAGANLAAVSALRAREVGGPVLSAQVLVCPSLDFEFGAPSFREYGEGYLVTTAAMAWFRDHYLRDHDRRDWRASPLHAQHFDGLAPAIIVTAGYDPMRDDGLAFADRLRAARVRVWAHHEPAAIHGYPMMGAISATAAPAIDHVITGLTAAFDRTEAGVM